MASFTKSEFQPSSENESFARELAELRERLYELEEQEISRVTEEQERFDALQVLDEYAKQIEESRDKLTRLFKAANAVQEARTIQEVLQKIAEAVQDAGWGSVSVSLFKNWQVVQAAYAGCTPEDIAFLESNRRSPSERARQYGPEFESFRVNRSYFVPAEELPGLLPVDTICPGRREVQPGDDWNPMDLAYVPLVGSGGRVIGCINCDDPVDGKRPRDETFTYLELFADIAASKVETTRLIEQQRRTAEAYRESEEKYRTLFTRSGEGYILMAEDRIRDCNQKICEIMENSRHDLLGSSLIAHAPALQANGQKSDDAAREQIAIALKNGYSSFGWRLSRKDGNCVECEVTFSTVDISGESLILAVIRDISDRKRTEAALEESEIRFQVIADSAPLLIWISDAAQNMTFFNKAWRDFSGNEYDDLKDNGWEAFVHSDDLIQLKSSIQTVFTSRQRTQVECRLRRSDGQYRWFLIVGAPRFDLTGAYVGFVGTGTEINQHMFDMRSDAMVSKVSKLLLARETMSAAYLDLPRIIRDWSEFAAVSIELRDTANADLVRVGESGLPERAPRRGPMNSSPAAECILSGQPIWLSVVPPDARKELETWTGIDEVASYLCVPIVLNHRVTGVISLIDRMPRDNIRDYHRPVEIVADVLAQVIERRRAEDESVRLAAFQRENPNVAVACDVRGNVTYVNPAGIQLLKEHNLPLFPGLLPPDHKLLVRKCVAENNAIHDVITRAAARTISWSYHSVPSVQTVHLIGIDVTDKERMERAIEAREARRQATLNAALDAIVTIDEQGMITEFNPAAERVFGYQAHEVLQQPLSELFIPQRYRDRHEQGLKHFLQTGEGSLIGKRTEVEAVRKDGTEFPVELSLSHVAYDGRSHFTAFIRDISARKSAESTARELELTMQQMVAALPEMVGVFNLRTFELQAFNNALRDELEFSDEEMNEMGARFVELLVHPDDIQTVTAHLKRLTTQSPGAQDEVSVRLMTKTGHVKHICCHIRVVSASAGGNAELIIVLGRIKTATE